MLVRELETHPLAPEADGYDWWRVHYELRTLPLTMPRGTGIVTNDSEKEAKDTKTPPVPATHIYIKIRDAHTNPKLTVKGVFRKETLDLPAPGEEETAEKTYLIL